MISIAENAPDVKVKILEETDFFKEFQKSPYYEQYLAASTGSAANYASAADVLRYPLIRYHGGVYLDTDDLLIAPFNSNSLKIPANGLLLQTPVSNEILGMNCQFNTNAFGAHKNSPILGNISEESYQRYLKNKELYSNRPRVNKGATPEEMKAYMKRISHVTGPGVFNDVAEARLPNLSYARKVVLLGENNIIPTDNQITYAAKNFRLKNVETGNENSWQNVR